MLCSCPCLNDSTYIADYTSSSAPYCSVLSSQAFPIPSPLNHFKAFLFATFSIKCLWWRKRGSVLDSSHLHTCSYFEQHQVGHRDDWGQPAGLAGMSNWKVLSTLEIMEQPDWTDTSSLCMLTTEQEISLTQTHTVQKCPNKKKRPNPSMPHFWSSGLNMLLLTQAEIYLKPERSPRSRRPHESTGKDKER